MSQHRSIPPAWLPIVAACLFACGVLSAQSYEYPFQNPKLPEQTRIANLLSLMTLEEKISALGSDPSVPRLGVVGAGHVEGLHGEALGGPGKWGRIRHPDRSFEDRPQPTTQFPQAIGLGQTWDVALLERLGRAEGEEVRYLFQSPKYQRGGLIVRAPNADLVRDPRWGRAEESYGEDAFLNGSLAAAMIRGLQGPDKQRWLTAALMKHFLANSNEDGRGGSSSNFDARLFHEYYALPFRMGVELGGSRCYMTSYNAVNGEPDTVARHIREVTMRQWGVDGIVCTDAGAMTNLVKEFHFAPDLAHAAALTIKAGVNQFLDNYREPLREALKQKLVSEKDLDAALAGVYRTMLRLGQLNPSAENAYRTLGQGPEPWLGEEHKRLAREAAREAIVLLKNKGLLPLDKSKIHSVALIGPYADQVLLDWYSGTPPYAVSILEALKEALPGARIDFFNGKIGSAREAAAKADVAIVVIGNHPTCDAPWAVCPTPSDGKEAIDRKSITLEQEKLARLALEGNPNTVVVLRASFPYAVNWSKEHAPAIIEMTHNAQEEGHALTDVLLGDYNPAGRLTESWPASIDELPPMMDYDIRHGRTYQYMTKAPLFAFGEGLSYTSFAYSELRIHRGDAGGMTISFKVKNTGGRAGDEVAQLYGAWLDSTVARPRQQLLGFARVSLRPGEEKRLTIQTTARQLQYFDETRGAFVDDPRCKLELQVGASSRDIRLRDLLTPARTSASSTPQHAASAAQ